MVGIINELRNRTLVWNGCKITMSDCKKIVIVIEKLPAVLTAEMRKEGSLPMAAHIKHAAFQYWQSVHSSYVVNSVIDIPSDKNEEQ